MTDKTTTPAARDANADPITKTPGSHPIGTGVGAAAGGAAAGVAGAALAGAASGAAMTGPAAPVGAVIGAVAGAVAGGLAGKGLAEKVDPTAEDAYWRTHHKPVVGAAADDYDRDYAPAYRHGYTAASASEHAGRKFEEVESTLARAWDETKGDSKIGWEKAKAATRSAWDRVRNTAGSKTNADAR